MHVFTLDKKVVAFDVRLTKPIKNLAAKGRVIFGMVEMNEGRGMTPQLEYLQPQPREYMFLIGRLWPNKEKPRTRHW